MSTPRPRWAWIALGLALGVAAALFLFVREPGRTLDAEALREARARWQREGLTDYALEIETSGATQAAHRIEVRGGQVVSMTTNGREATRSAWEYWSVEGLFLFLDTEIANAADPRRAFGVEPGQVVLRVRFEERWGYPEFFLRHVMGRGRGVEWRVVVFEPGG
ncbi:MAG: DUF6174 domain-containing protein [Thermoanaerobaculia bacterium]|nr:DUF6174 domain-containing protein [Thermoanaerobaculia bacterium]